MLCGLGIYQCVGYELSGLDGDEYMGRTIDIGGWFEVLVFDVGYT